MLEYKESLSERVLSWVMIAMLVLLMAAAAVGMVVVIVDRSEANKPAEPTPCRALVLGTYVDSWCVPGK